MIKKSLLMGFIFVLTANYSPQALSMELASASDSEEVYSSSAHTISNGLYIGGGVASIFVGFGIGHAIQGRYGEKGWIFTVADLVAIGGYFTSVVFLAGDVMDAAEAGETISAGTVKKKGGLALGFLAAMVGVRIWEIIDAWMLPSHYKVVKESPFQAAPLISWNHMNSSFDVGLSLKYKF